MQNLKKYDEVIDYLNSKNREHHLLIGNGFSISYDKEMFSYNALHNFIINNQNEMVIKIFNLLKTENFELVMQQLENFSEIAKLYDIPDKIISNFNKSINDLRKGLIDAISSLHPQHIFTVPEHKSKSCATFFSEYLNNNGHIFSTNYDLLMYWILMRNRNKECIDGFGRIVENNDEGKSIKDNDMEWSDLIWGKHKTAQNIHYLHGALPIFDEGPDIIKAECKGEWLLDIIKRKVQNKKYPIFVAAGNSRQKMEHISHNKYLTYCYDRLTNITGSLIVFGFSFGDNDKHIIDAINKAAIFRDRKALLSIYIGVYSENDYEHILSIKKLFKCRKVELFDAKSVNIWGLKK